MQYVDMRVWFAPCVGREEPGCGACQQPAEGERWPHAALCRLAALQHHGGDVAWHL